MSRCSSLLVVVVISTVAMGGCSPAPASDMLCTNETVGLTLPDNFCAIVVADEIGPARHLTVSDNGDVFVALAARRNTSGGVIVLRDTTGDGVADVESRFAGGAGDDVEFRGGYLYYATNDAIMRYPWSAGAMRPTSPPDTIVSGLPAAPSHRAKSFAFGGDGALYVNIGSPSNSCQRAERQDRSPGIDPCPQLETRAGIWRFEADQLGQRQRDGRRFATGMRNTVALTVRPADSQLYGVIHGRDQLLQNWGNLFDDVQSAEKPAEEFVRIEDGNNFGWPYCYYDPELERKVLAPEYGGDGTTEGRCAEMDPPLIGFPGHWAPDGIHFYGGNQFPLRYRGGAFVAFHGSWNRDPRPQAGYNVVFVPFDADGPSGDYEVFATGFSTDPPNVSGPHRPVGVAEGPDGSLYISDDSGGRIYRILYVGDDR